MTAAEYPPQFDTWPRESQIRYVTMSMSRLGLLRALVSQAGFDPHAQDLNKDSRLTKTHLAGIYLLIEGFA